MWRDFICETEKCYAITVWSGILKKEIKDLYTKFNFENSDTRLNGGHNFVAERMTRGFKKVLLKTRQLEKARRRG